MKKIFPDRGSILIYVLFVTSIVFLISIYSLNISLNDRVVAGTLEDDKKGYYIAKAGNEFAIYMFVNGEMDVNDEITIELNGGYFEASILELEIISETSNLDSNILESSVDEKNGYVREDDDDEAEEELEDEIEEEDDLELSVRVFISSTGYYKKARSNIENEYEVIMPASFFEAD